MADAPFSNREIREYFSDIKKDVAEIIVQTKKTNGRVSGLENWKWFITGGLAILSILVLPILFMFVTKVI